jgi:hypothetical protein
MNRIVLIIVTLGVSYTSTAQQDLNKPPKGTYQYHLQKQKSNRTAGWVLLSGGLLLGITGVAIDLGNMFEPGKEDDKTGQIVSYTGIAAMAGSIPCFIAAGNHKRKALFLKSQPTATVQPGKFRSIPSLTLEIDL